MTIYRGLIQLRARTVSEWLSDDIVLQHGRVGAADVGSSNPMLKIGDGVRPWSALPLLNSPVYYEEGTTTTLPPGSGAVVTIDNTTNPPTISFGIPAGELAWAIIPAEDSAGVVPTDYSHEPGNVLRYGNNAVPGTTDMTAALVTANTVALAAGLPVTIPEVIHVATPTTIAAPVADRLSQMFSTTSQVTLAGSPFVRPEWWGAGQNTVRYAINALPAGGGVVQLENKTYLANGFAYGFSGSGVCISKANVTLLGRRMPRLADDCRSLTGGTIIQGMVSAFADNFEARDLGVDNGYSVGQAAFGGEPPAGRTDALVLTYPDDATKAAAVTRKTARLHNVIGLAYGPASPAHAVIAGEGYVNVTCTGEVIGCYGVHGVVFKCASVRAEQVTAYCNNDDGLIIKSDVQASAVSTDIQIGRVHVDARGPRGLSPYAIATTGYGVYFHALGNHISRIQIGEVQAYEYPIGLGVSFGGNYAIDDVVVGRIVTDQGAIGGTRQGVQLLSAATQMLMRWQIGSIHARNTTVGLQALFAQTGELHCHLTVGELSVTNATTAADVGSASYVSIDTVVAANCSDAVYRMLGTPRLSTGTTFKDTITPALYSSASGGLSPSLANGWTQFASNDPFNVDLAGGRICLRGLLVPGSTNVISVLPLWARPITNKRFMVQGFNGSVTASVPLVVDTAGNVKVNEVAGGVANCATWLSLAGVTYDQQA